MQDRRQIDTLVNNIGQILGQKTPIAIAIAIAIIQLRAAQLPTTRRTCTCLQLAAKGGWRGRNYANWYPRIQSGESH